jgi:hypothetical protein
MFKLKEIKKLHLRKIIRLINSNNILESDSEIDDLMEMTK